MSRTSLEGYALGVTPLLAAIAALAVMLAACATLDDSLTDLEVGDCVRDPDPAAESLEILSLDEVDCGDPLALEVTHVFDITGLDEFPGTQQVDQIAIERCPLTSKVHLSPTKESWDRANDRTVICLR